VKASGDSSTPKQGSSKLGTPGPDFWSWLPPVQSRNKPVEGSGGLKPSKKVEAVSGSAGYVDGKGTISGLFITSS
jgi:hypothetical protein